HQDLLEGRTLSQALARHPKAFGPVELGLIRVGEAGGLLDDTLLQLAHLLEWEMEMRNQLKQAFQYPVIVLGTLAFAMTAMVVFVLPRFARMFQSLHIQLPLQTRLLMALSYVISHFGWLIALLLAGAAAGWLLYLRTSAGRLRWHRWKLRLPLLGPVCVELAMSRFARVVAALNRAGVPILETLALAGQSVNNRYVQQVIGNVRNRVKGGDNLANALRREPLFPPVVVQMVATGEEAGRLDELLQSVSDYYDQQVRYFVKKLVTYLEPALLIVVGIGVLVMATAVLVPMWDLVKVFKR
ncbi:MAG: type II secretion system F family protein, partial [Candidatus Omnitrophica bacterium]|nr:type II secretion system F family protein [Candidatus Omnitrophota bacterium]